MKYLEKKKLAFMSIVNQIKGFVRTVLGVPPLTLPDCVDTDSVINYKIDGNSVQDGTPTPEAPVEVESVGELCTKNLFSEYIIASKGFETHTMINNGVIMHPTSLNSYQSYINFKLGDVVLGSTYTVSLDLEWDITSGAKPMIRFGYVNTGGGFSYLRNAYPASSGRHKNTFTVPEEMPTDMGKYGFTFLVNYTHVNVTELVDLTITNIQLEEGDTATEYEPYGKYKIPVVCGQLLDYLTYKRGYFINSSGVEATDGGYKCTEDYIPVLPNTTYRIICAGYVVKEVSLTMPFYDSNKNFISRIAFGTFAEVPKIREFTTPNDCYYIRFSLPNATTYDVSLYNLENTTNIYLDEPLRKVGSVADTIDFEKQLITRKVGKWMFTDYNTNGYLDHYSARMSETQAWTTCCVAIPFRNMAVGYTNKFVSHFKRGSNGQAFSWKTATHGIYCGHSDYYNIYINLGDSKTLYNANDNPITNWEHWDEAYVIAEMITPTETPITLPKLPTIKGTTIYSIDTAIQPSNMEVTYYSTSKE